ncbi:MAG: hypothetical protein K0R54_1734 [Clostridiaceae bacterium]|nr:hypothetical protein [Clostridiaceae bacterium]
MILNNKKIVRMVIIAAVLITSSCFQIACSNANKQSNNQKKENKFDIKTATNVADTYMKYLMKEDTENAKKLYSKELLQKSDTKIDTDLKIKGYNVIDVTEMGKSGLFKIRVTRVNLKKAYTCLDEYTIKVEKEENDYKISETKDVVIAEAFNERNQIRYKNKNNVKTNLIIEMTSIPTYAIPKDDDSNVNKEIVPRNGFGPINFAYNGDMLCVTTQSEDAYSSIVKIDETLAVQGDEGKKQGDTQKKSDSENTEGTNVREKPIGKNITNVDIIKSCTIEFMTFSMDEKFLLIQYNKPGAGRFIRVYKTDSGDLIPFKFEKNYSIDTVDTVFSSFDKGVLNFDVVEKGGADKAKAAANIIGKWQLNLKTFKANKM